MQGYPPAMRRFSYSPFWHSFQLAHGLKSSQLSGMSELSKLSTPIQKAIGEVATSILNTSQLKEAARSNAAIQIEVDLGHLVKLVIEALKEEAAK